MPTWNLRNANSARLAAESHDEKSAQSELNRYLLRRPANKFTWCSGILPRLGLTSVIPARVAAVREESRILPRQA
jgi:hypothetical protein